MIRDKYKPDQLTKNMAISKKNKKWIIKICYVYVSALIFFSIIGDRGLFASYRIWKESQNMEREIENLRSNVQDLNEQVRKFRNDDKTIEQYAREKMNLSGNDEIQFIFK